MNHTSFSRGKHVLKNRNYIPKADVWPLLFFVGDFGNLSLFHKAGYAWVSLFSPRIILTFFLGEVIESSFLLMKVSLKRF